MKKTPKFEVSKFDLLNHLNYFLNSPTFDDFGPNGLQVDGTERISRIAFAVTSSKQVIDEAIEKKADALIVHHGLFWKGTPQTVTGSHGARILALARSHMNLYAYHLPLDAHPELGNNAVLARLLDLAETQPFGFHRGNHLGVKGYFKEEVCALEVAAHLESILDHPVVISSYNPKAVIKSIGIISGGAGGELHQAKSEGLDAYLTGEISESHWHEAMENEIHLFAGGHGATETFGIKELMKHIKETFQVDCFFIKTENPI